MSLLLQTRYRLLKQLGKGGFCKTFIAMDESQSPQLPCIVQQIPPVNQTSETFQQLSKKLEEISIHPQIPRLLEYFEHDGQFYLVQEFIKGDNLATVLSESGVFDETQIWQLLKDLLPVLQFIHQQNIIHRDIKPENIIRPSPPLTKEGDFILVDFAIAKLTTAPELTSCIGSPEYSAPEQTQGRSVFASDLYSLGVTCVHLLTGIPTFDLFDAASDRWVWKDYLTQSVSDRLAKILDQLLEKTLNRRFQTVAEVMQAMGIELQAQNDREKPKILWHCTHTIALNSSVNAIAIPPNGKILATHDDKTIKLWDLNTNKLLATLSGHSQAVKSLAFSPLGKILASASDDKTIKLWNLDILEETHTLIGHSKAVKSVAFSPDGKLLASGSWDKTIKLWDINTRKEIFTLCGHQLQVSAIAFSPLGNLFASASFDRTIRLWEIGEISAGEKKFQNCPYKILSGHAWAVLTVAFSPDSTLLATGSDDNTIKIWDTNTGQVISTLNGHSWSVTTVAFTPDGKTLISGSSDTTIKIWKVSITEEITTLSSHVDSVSCVAVSPVAQLIFSGSRDKTIKLWELRQQQKS